MSELGQDDEVQDRSKRRFLKRLPLAIAGVVAATAVGATAIEVVADSLSPPLSLSGDKGLVGSPPPGGSPSDKSVESGALVESEVSAETISGRTMEVSNDGQDTPVNVVESAEGKLYSFLLNKNNTRVALGVAVADSTAGEFGPVDYVDGLPEVHLDYSFVSMIQLPDRNKVAIMINVQDDETPRVETWVMDLTTREKNLVGTHLIDDSKHGMTATYKDPLNLSSDAYYAVKAQPRTAGAEVFHLQTDGTAVLETVITKAASNVTGLLRKTQNGIRWAVASQVDEAPTESSPVVFASCRADGADQKAAAFLDAASWCCPGIQVHTLGAMIAFVDIAGDLVVENYNVETGTLFNAQTAVGPKIRINPSPTLRAPTIGMSCNPNENYLRGVACLCQDQSPLITDSGPIVFFSYNNDGVLGEPTLYGSNDRWSVDANAGNTPAPTIACGNNRSGRICYPKRAPPSEPLGCTDIAVFIPGETPPVIPTPDPDKTPDPTPDPDKTPVPPPNPFNVFLAGVFNGFRGKK